MLRTRIEGTLCFVERVGLMILLTPFGEPLPRWRLTKQFGLEELEDRTCPSMPSKAEHKYEWEKFKAEHGGKNPFEFYPCQHSF